MTNDNVSSWNLEDAVHLSHELQRELLERYRRKDDLAARDRLVSTNLRFVEMIARERQFRNEGVPLDDRIGYGVQGLLRATDKYDLDEEIPFINYAAWWIRQKINRGIRDEEQDIRIPDRWQERITKYRKRINELVDEGYTSKAAKKQAWEEFELSPLETRIAESDGKVELDAPVHDEKGSKTYGETHIVGDSPNPESDYEESELEEHLYRALNEHTHDERGRRILERHFGLNGYEETSLADIGRELGISRERVRQIKDRDLEKIRESEIGSVLREYAS